MRPISRHLTRAAALFMGLAALPSPLAAEPPVAGQWLTEGGAARVEVASCAELPGAPPAAPAAGPDTVCGAIVWLREPDNEAGMPKLDRNNPEEALRSRPIVGLVILEGFTPAAEPGSWEGGRIYNPEDGETYKSTLTLQDGGASLEVRGYVGLPIFGRSQVWARSE